jgi:protein-tyrosine phosphatase
MGGKNNLMSSSFNRSALYITAATLAAATAATLLYRRRPAPRSHPHPNSLIIQPRTPFSTVRQPDGSLRVSWQTAAPPVRLFTSPDPQLRDELHLVAEPVGAEEITLADLDPAVRYYFMAEMADGRRYITAERLLPLPSAVNLRDIGGYETADGRATRWGQIYRSGEFANLADGDVRYLERLGLRLICDLRTSEELEKSSSRLPTNPQLTLRHTPIYERQQGAAHWLMMLVSNRKSLDKVWLNDIYLERFVERGAEAFGRILTMLADGRQRPALIHCTAGKDRTGIAIALLLALLGVPEETVVADYTLSNSAYDALFRSVAADAQRLAVFGLQTADLFPILTAQAHIMHATLRYLEQTYGGVEPYLVQRAGVSAESIQQLRDGLLE